MNVPIRLLCRIASREPGLGSEWGWTPHMYPASSGTTSAFMVAPMISTGSLPRLCGAPLSAPKVICLLCRHEL